MQRGHYVRTVRTYRYTCTNILSQKRLEIQAPRSNITLSHYLKTYVRTYVRTRVPWYHWYTCTYVLEYHVYCTVYSRTQCTTTVVGAGSGGSSSSFGGDLGGSSGARCECFFSGDPCCLDGGRPAIAVRGVSRREHAGTHGTVVHYHHGRAWYLAGAVLRCRAHFLEKDRSFTTSLDWLMRVQQRCHCSCPWQRRRRRRGATTTKSLRSLWPHCGVSCCGPNPSGAASSQTPPVAACS